LFRTSESSFFFLSFFFFFVLFDFDAPREARLPGKWQLSGKTRNNHKESKEAKDDN